jgi:hypothetical protein
VGQWFRLERLQPASQRRPTFPDLLGTDQPERRIMRELRVLPGLLDESDDRRYIAQLSLPSRIPYMMAVSRILERDTFACVPHRGVVDAASRTPKPKAGGLVQELSLTS